MSMSGSCDASDKHTEYNGDEHESLPHFSFLLCKVDVVLDFCNLRIPLVVLIHLNLSQQQPVSSSFLFLCDCTLSPTVSQLHTLPRAQGTTVSTDSFSRGYGPFTRARRARPLTDVG